MLELKNVSKKYGKMDAVSNVSFSVEGGQVLGLVGHNGAGKSTCVSMIATLLKPDSGTILFEGKDIVKEPDAIRSKLGFVPQDIALYESLSGLDNLKFWGKSYGVPSKDLDAEIKRVCGIISFDETLLKRRVSAYSGGMKRRLNIGVALLHRPKLVILDEPTTGIDIQSGTQILNAIEGLKAQGTAIIYVGHYVEEVERISTHLCFMEQGECKVFGTIKEVLEKTGKGSLSELLLGERRS
ncbi:MAG: ABC transporter ATP-binding protein [Lachnospiraceae bacterium]|nr:ABC transporter ATP-binding protein [Lachnospiraceae bacterium]